MPVERLYVNHGLTGTNRDRPGLQEALAACRAGDTLVSSRLDLVIAIVTIDRALWNVEPILQTGLDGLRLDCRRRRRAGSVALLPGRRVPRVGTAL